MGTLERWVNELQCEIDKINRKLSVANFTTGVDTLLICDDTKLAGEPYTVSIDDINKCAFLILTIRRDSELGTGYSRFMYSRTINKDVWLQYESIFDEYCDYTQYGYEWHNFTARLEPKTGGGFQFRISVEGETTPTLHIGLIGVVGSSVTPTPNLLTKAINAVKKVTKKTTTKNKKAR